MLRIRKGLQNGMFSCVPVVGFFGNTSALTNQTPFAATGFRPGDLSIPKRIRRVGQTDFMRAAEILRYPIAGFRMSRFYLEAQLEQIENSADEICDLVQEMVETLEGRFQELPSVSQFRDDFKKNLTPEYYCYGTAGKIAASFIMRHQYMFLDLQTT